MTLEEKILKVRNSKGVSRADLASLLAFIGEPGKKRTQKVSAVKQLNLENNQGFRVEDDLESYPEF